MSLREQNERLVTALKQISDLTGTAANIEYTPACVCIECQVHRIAKKALRT